MKLEDLTVPVDLFYGRALVCGALGQYVFYTAPTCLC